MRLESGVGRVVMTFLLAVCARLDSPVLQLAMAGHYTTFLSIRQGQSLISIPLETAPAL